MYTRSSRNFNIVACLMLAALGIGLIVSYLTVSFSAFNERLDNFVYDSWARISAKPQANPQIAIVDIDESSLKKIGQLPWPRTILADLVNMLLIQGVSAIGLDMWFTEPDRSSPIAVDSQLEKDFGLNLDFTNLPQTVLDNDRYFSKSIAGKPVVLGAYASFNGEGDFPETMPKSVQVLEIGKTYEKNPAEYLTRPSGLVAPLPIFAKEANIGLLNVSLEEDGIVRSMPLLVKAKEAFYPSLSLETLMTAKKIDNLKLESLDNQSSLIHMGDIKIPVETDGSFRPVYYGSSGAFPYYSAADILDGKIGRKELEGKIIFIAPSAHSLKNDRSTPLDRSVLGAEIHATIAENILTGNYISLMPHSKEIQICVIFLSALLGVLMFRFFPLPIYVPLFLALAGLYIFISWLCFQNSLLFSPAGAIIALILSGLAILPGRYWQTQKEKRKIQKAFSHYVTPEIVSRIIKGGEELLKGEQKNLTIMFTDIRGFTAIAEKLSPQHLIRLLNSYFTPMTACVTARHGTLDKYIGDALMAFWNAPLDIANHSFQAVMAALDMQKELAKMRPGIKNEFDIDMQMGIGINTGTAHVGNMGSDDLFNYTCIGDNVNLASRLEGMCKRYGVNIVVSSSVKEACENAWPFLLLDKIQVKGSIKPQKIYAPLEEKIQIDSIMLAQWESALNNYFKGAFANAEKEFEKCSINPFLARLSTIFISRCQNLLKAPPKNWNGVWVYNEK